MTALSLIASKAYTKSHRSNGLSPVRPIAAAKASTVATATFPNAFSQLRSFCSKIRARSADSPENSLTQTLPSPLTETAQNDPYTYLQPRDPSLKTVSLLIDDELVEMRIPPNFKKDCCERLKECFSINGRSVPSLLEGVGEEEAETHLLAHIYSQLPVSLNSEEKINLLQNITKTMTQSVFLKLKNLINEKIENGRFPENAKNTIELWTNDGEVRVCANANCVFGQKLREDGRGWETLDSLIRVAGSINFNFSKTGELTIYPSIETQTLPSINITEQVAKKRGFQLSEQLHPETIQQFQDPRSKRGGPFVKRYYGTTDQNQYHQQLWNDLGVQGAYRHHLTNVISKLETGHQAVVQEVISKRYFEHFQEPAQGELVFGPSDSAKPVWTRKIPKNVNEPVTLECEAQMIIRDSLGSPLPEDRVRVATVKTLYVINDLGEVSAIHDLTIKDRI